MKNLILSAGVLAKLRDKHGITVREVEQCFENLCGEYLEDTREDNQTDPPTLWFVAPTNQDRLLKVIFVFRDGNVYLKSAFQADAISIAIYDKFGK
jgi:uncharacterized DUF497 family protein